MTKLPIHIVDAFTDRRFAGNSAAVVPLDRYPDDALLQAIAAENNLAETAFIEPFGDDWNLRWFTPTVEVPLCGHATLASAWVVLNKLQPERHEVRFHTRVSGVLTVRRTEDGLVMDFPAGPAVPTDISTGMAAALGGIEAKEVLISPAFLLAILDNAAQVRSLKPDFAAIEKLEREGLIVSAPGDEGYDIVSRFFTPAHGIPEDPVTGGAHCMLTPYWCERLGKPTIRAFQASARGGEMTCTLNGDRVEMHGRCVPYLTGEIEAAF